jgi:hypothetical protein
MPGVYSNERIGSNHCAHVSVYYAEQYYRIRNLGTGERNDTFRRLIFVYYVLSL